MRSVIRGALGVAISASLVTLAFSATAQGNSAASLQMVQAGGQLNAYALSCGKATQGQVAEKRKGMRDKFVGGGMSASTFDSTYDAAYGKVVTAAKSDPERMKTACVQLESRLKAMEAQSRN